MDPACFQRSQVNEATIAQAVASRGYTAVKASTNDPEARDRGGRAPHTSCRHDRRAPDRPRLSAPGQSIGWGYRYKKSAAGDVVLTFEKNHHSHIAEAHQYGCLHYNAQFSQTYAGMRVQRKEIKRKVYTYA